MLQDNVAGHARGAHVAHASLMGLHTICCGAPLLALAAASLSGAAASVFLPASFVALHDFIHVHEIWVLILSACLLAVGSGLELRARLGGGARGFPLLLVMSALCFLANAAFILGHRLSAV